MEEQTKETEIRLQDLWSVFKSCWWLMLIVTVLVAALVFTFLNVTHEDEYTATVSLYVMNSKQENAANGNNTNTSINTSDISIAANLINDFETLAKSRDRVLNPVIDQLGTEISAEDLSKMYTISREENSRILYLSITSPSPESCATVADAIGDQVCVYLNGRFNEELVTVVDGAKIPENPSNPVSMMMVMLIGLVGAVVVYGVFVVKFMMNDKINNADDVEKYLGLSMLGVIPNKYESSRKKSKGGYYYRYYGSGEKKRVE